MLRRIPVLRERLLRTWSHDAPRAVPWVLGAALAIRRSMFDAVAGFDPGYFMYGEELDLCWRLRDRGFATHFAPVTTVVHVGGASTAAVATEMRREFVVSHVRHLRQNGGSRSAPAALRTLRLIVLARCARESLRMRLARTAAARSRGQQEVLELRALLGERSLWKL